MPQIQSHPQAHKILARALASALALCLTCSGLLSAQAREPENKTEAPQWQVELAYQQGLMGPAGLMARGHYLSPWLAERLALGAQLGYLLPGFASHSIGGVDSRLEALYFLEPFQAEPGGLFFFSQWGLQWVLPESGGPQLFHQPWTLGSGLSGRFGELGLSARLAVDLSTIVQNKYDRAALVELSVGSRWSF